MDLSKEGREEGRKEGKEGFREVDRTGLGRAVSSRRRKEGGGRDIRKKVGRYEGGS